MTTKVTIEFEVEMKQDESDEMISCFIPSINGYFSANTIDDVERKAKGFIKSFIKFNKEVNNKEVD